MKVWHFPYTVNSPWHKSDHPGALLRLEFPAGQVGHSDLHPWPELGEPPLSELLGRLRLQHEHPLITRALQIAAEDAAARARGASLHQGQTVPASHKLLVGLSEVTSTNLEAWIEQGYRCFKVKIGTNLARETTDLKSLMSRGVGRWRLDFNGRLRATDFQTWWSENESWLVPQLDGLEDPVAAKEVATLEAIMQNKPATFSKVPFFEDRVSLQRAIGRVVKPEVQNHRPQSETSKRIWVTNNLAHPFGHAVTLTYAARWGTGEACGLQGLDHYTSANPIRAWCEQIRYHGPVTLPPSGTGFGFDGLLAKLAWKPLS